MGGVNGGERGAGWSCGWSGRAPNPHPARRVSDSELTLGAVPARLKEQEREIAAQLTEFDRTG